MNIADNRFLDDIHERSVCPGCGASRMYFCYTCCLPMTCIADRIPRVELPFALDIIKHPTERDGKSTAVHCPILAPNQAKLYKFPNEIPDYYSQDQPYTTILVYPSPDAQTLDSLSSQDSNSKLKDLHQRPVRFVFLDCTWAYAFKMFTHEKVKHLPMVKISDYKTQFWRPSYKRADTDLATIEAIYYLTVEFHKKILNKTYEGQYDNLLFFFDHFLRKIHGQGFQTQF